MSALILQPRAHGKRLAMRERLQALQIANPGKRIGFATPDGLEIWQDGKLVETKRYGRNFDQAIIDEVKA